VPVPLRTVVETREANCADCGTSPHVELHFFIETYAGVSELVCQSCLSKEGGQFETTLEDLTPAPASRRKVLRRQKRLSAKQELAIAGELGGRMQKASGAMAHAKGDVRVKHVARVEAKYTEARSYKVELDELYKIASEASHGEVPVLAVDFLEKGTGRLRDRFVVLHFNTLKELLNASRKDQ
jgi:hypothetical protein